MTYKIEKAIPPPNKVEYPFHQMKKGDSFFIPTSSVRDANRARSRVGGRARSAGREITTRTERDADNNITGLRVWVLNDPEDSDG